MTTILDYLRGIRERLVCWALKQATQHYRRSGRSSSLRTLAAEFGSSLATPKFQVIIVDRGAHAGAWFKTHRHMLEVIRDCAMWSPDFYEPVPALYRGQTMHVSPDETHWAKLQLLVASGHGELHVVHNMKLPDGRRNIVEHP